MRKRFYTSLLFLAPLTLFCQEQIPRAQTAIDSLQRLLPGSEMVRQVDLLNELASLYAPVNFDSSITYSVQAQRIASVYGYPAGVGVARLYTGNAYYFKMDFKNALISYLSAQNFLEDGKHTNELGELNLMLGHINFFIMRNEMAVSYYHKALENFVKAGNEYSQGDALHELSITYWRAGPLDSAVLYGHKYLRFAREHHFRFLEASAMVNLGMSYVDDSSFFYNDQALKIAKELNDDRVVGVIYNNIASVYEEYHPGIDKVASLKLVRTYYEMASEAALRTNYNALLAMIYNSLANVDIQEGKYQQAKAKLDDCEATISAYKHSPGEQPPPLPFYAFGKIFETFLILRTRYHMFESRFKLAMETGNYSDAVKYQRLFFESGDTLRAEQQGKQLELLMAEAEAEKTDQKIRSLAQENELNQFRLARSRFISGTIAAAVIIISLTLLLFFQRKRLKAERKSVSMEQRLLRAQMNPHFLFNSLASIQNYIINENTDQASIYLSRFSQLVRNILDNSVEEYVPLEKEIETIENYLELQKVRYADKFDFTIEVDEKIDEENMMIPPMLAQPFIENSIEHGIKYRETMGHIEVRFRLEDSLIRFEVEDDGVGREKAHEIETKHGTKHRSMATSITIDRLSAINKKLKKKIRLEIIDLKDDKGEGCGTKVTFGIPVVVR